MNKFKVGQIVRYIGSSRPFYNNGQPWFKLGTHFNVVEKCKKNGHWICEELQEAEPYPLKFYEEEFEIVKDIPEFDMKKEKWFIKYKDSTEFYAIKDWLVANDWYFPSGLKYSIFGSNKLFTNTYCDGDTLESIMWATEAHSSCKEIKVSFKTIIDSVEYPSIETEQQKQIRELEETIAKAAEQIKQLKGN